MRPHIDLRIASLILSLAVGLPASASINYTPVQKVIPNGTSFPIDFNHDGFKDFWIRSTFDIPYCGLRSGIRGNVDLLPAKAISGVILKGGFAAALPAGSGVGHSQVFAQGKTPLLSFYTCGGGGASGNWLNVSNHYLGLEFQVAGRTHYGWVQLSVKVDRTALTTVVVGFAYETVAGKAIITGETGVPDDCGLPSTDQTIHICSPLAGSTVSANVVISVQARWDGQTIHHMRIYVDNVDRFDVDAPVGSEIKTTVSLTPGGHHLVVTAWNILGHSIQSGETFTTK